VPAAFTYTTGEAHWQVLLRARAIETQCYVLAANQCGWHDDQRRTWGHSQIIDPWGQVLAELADEPGVVVAELDAEWLAEVRRRRPSEQHKRCCRRRVGSPAGWSARWADLAATAWQLMRGSAPGRHCVTGFCGLRPLIGRRCRGWRIAGYARGLCKGRYPLANPSGPRPS